MSDIETIHAAFGHDTALCDRILAAAKESRDRLQLFVDIARYTSRLASQQNGADAPPAKKRKLEDDNNSSAQTGNNSTYSAPASLTTVYSVPDTSFAVPQRKKMSLELAMDATNPALGNIGVTNEAAGISLAVPFSAIDQVFCLPVPEKAQRQWNFVVFSQQAWDAKTGKEASDAQQLVWTMNEVPPATVKCQAGFEPVEQDTYVTSCLRSLNACLRGSGKTCIIPTAQEFASAIPQSHRKGEPAYHVKGHRGSKDGYLFFLSRGIVWAFKKPLAFFPFENIESISYTSVLQRTFNLVITTMPDAAGKQEEIEFSMLDQADFAGIDDYVKRHDLNDASMAAERRAKKLNINGKPKAEDAADGAAAANGDEEEDEETELQKAERELQDQEDEEEEDYDPGSEGESEGSGSDSEDEDGAEGQDDEDDEDGLEDEE